MTFGGMRRATVCAAAICGAMGGLVSGTVAAPFAFALVAVGFYRWLRPANEKLIKTFVVRVVLPAIVLPMAGAAAVGLATNTLAGFSNMVCALIGVKLAMRLSPRDDDQIVLLSGVLFLAAAALRQDIEFGLWFAAYVFLFVPAALLSTAARSTNNLNKLDAQKGATNVVLRSVPISLLLLIVSAVLFVVIPRVGWGFAQRPNESGLRMSGFSSRVELGGHGRIKLDDTIVMRVEVEDARFRGRNAPALHWRGTALDHYSRGRWMRGHQAPRTRKKQSHRNFEKTTFLVQSLIQNHKPLEKLSQTIYLETYGSNVMFGAEAPLKFVLPYKRSKPVGEYNDEVRYTGSGSLRYDAVSVLPPADTTILREAPRAPDAMMRPFLQMPSSLRPRFSQLAQTITKQANNDYERARAVEKYLRSFEYTTELTTVTDIDPVEDFLFRRKAGHCEFFASGMVLLLRSQGVPARVVNGFLGGEWNEYENFIAVRAGDAHSWVEVHFQGIGWIQFDPTPSSEVDLLGRGGSGFAERLRRFFDAMRHKWRKWVLDYDLKKQLQVFTGVKNAIGNFFAGIGKHPMRLLYILAVVIGVVALVWLKRRLGGPRRQVRRAASPDRLLMQYWRLLEWLQRKNPPSPGQTAQQYVESIAASSEVRASLAALTEIYHRRRFGQQLEPDDETRVTALVDAVKKAV